VGDPSKKGSDPFPDSAGKGSDPFFSTPLSYEMALTRDDFLRLLPAAVGSAPFRVDGDEIVSQGSSPGWRIRLEDRPPRRLGPVGIPVLAVSLRLEGATAQEAKAFEARFLLGFQRAGG
jgi:hypothetical protein